jgi:hypothetical protein
MVTEEVEPGVFQVTSDGVRDLTSFGAVDIVAGYDGGIWLLRQDESLQLGSDETHEWPHLRAGGRVFEVTPDGTMWVIAADGPKWVIAGRGYVEYPEARGRAAFYSTDGEDWTLQPCPWTGDDGGSTCSGLTVAPDGTVWATWVEEGGRRVDHLGPAGWQPLDGYFRDSHGTAFYPERLFFTDAGDVYGVDYYFGTLYRHDDGGWQHVAGGRLVDVGRHGMVWQAEGPDNDASFPYNDLARLADGELTRWTSADLPDVRLGLDYEFEVAPDGSLWFSLWRIADGEPPEGDWWLAVRDGHLVCDGLARFDGESVDRFLAGRCTSMDIAADGSIWVVSDDDLYVITPEAVAATE